MAAQEGAESILCFLTVVSTRGETGIKSCKHSHLLLSLGETILNSYKTQVRVKKDFFFIFFYHCFSP